MHLFGAFAKGLTDTVKLNSLAMGLGHDATVCRCVLASKSPDLHRPEPALDSIAQAAQRFDPAATQRELPPLNTRYKG